MVPSWVLRAAAALVFLAQFAGAPAAGADEVPFVPSSTNVVDVMLEIAGVTASDYVVDLGSGDGRIPIAAARRFGARALGIEYDPKLVSVSRAGAVNAGVADRVEFREEDIFVADFSTASVVTMYLLPDVNFELRPRVLFELRPGTRVVSHDFDMADWEPDRQVTIPDPDKKVGARQESTVYLWVVPARVAGAWRGTLSGPAGDEPVVVELEQQFQKVHATIWRQHGSISGSGRIRGDRIDLQTTGSAVPFQSLQFTLRVAAGRLEGEARDGDRRIVLRVSRIMD